MTLPLATPSSPITGATEAPARPVRVLQVINALGNGGAERQLVALARGMDPARMRCEVAVLRGGGRYEPDLAAAGIPVRAFERRGRFSMGFLPALARHARGFDVVHAWLTPAVLFGLLAARMARVPVCVGSERGSTYARPGRWHHALLRAEARLLRGADGVIANSRSGADFARTRGIDGDRLHVVTNGLPPDWPPAGAGRAATRASLGIPGERFTLLLAASFTPKKDHQTLFAALRHVVDAGHDPCLLLAGDGPLRDTLRAAVSERGLDDHVRFLGERRDVADLLRASDLAVLSSKEREGCSNFVMEALSLGVPVLATDAGGTAEIVDHGDTGWIVPAGDARAIGGALATLLTDTELRARLSVRGLAEARERFAPRRMVEETCAHYVRWLMEKAPR